MTDPSKRRRRKTTVGSIVVPELPWQRIRDIDREAELRVQRARVEQELKKNRWDAR